jgi:Uma2 family endonuclease
MNVITPGAPLPNSPASFATPPVIAAPDRKRFTVAEYDRLTDLGFFDHSGRVELIYGDLVQMASQGTAHIFCCQRLNKQLVLTLENEIVQCQAPIILLPYSEPEPDFAILVAGADGKQAADKVVLVIEVSDSSLVYDRAVKGPLYAEALIPHYWIFNAVDRQVECLSQPQQSPQGGWAYGLQQIILPNQMLALPQPLNGAIDLTKIFA